MAPVADDVIRLIANLPVDRRGAEWRPARAVRRRYPALREMLPSGAPGGVGQTAAPWPGAAALQEESIGV